MNTYYVSQIVTRTSRIGGFWATTTAVRGAEENAAPPAPCNRLHRIACLLIDEQNFDHGRVRCPRLKDGAALVQENAAQLASAMQFFAVSAITRP